MGDFNWRDDIAQATGNSGPGLGDILSSGASSAGHGILDALASIIGDPQIHQSSAGAPPSPAKESGPGNPFLPNPLDILAFLFGGGQGARASDGGDTGAAQGATLGMSAGEPAPRSTATNHGSYSVSAPGTADRATANYGFVPASSIRALGFDPEASVGLANIVNQIKDPSQRAKAIEGFKPTELRPGQALMAGAGAISHNPGITPEILVGLIEEAMKQSGHDIPLVETLQKYNFLKTKTK